MQIAVENVLEHSPLVSIVPDAMDKFPYNNHGLENDLPPHRKPI